MNISMQAQRGSRGITLIMLTLGCGCGDECWGGIKLNRLICKLLHETKMEISLTFLPEISFGSELH